MLATSMDDDLAGGAKEAMKKLEGRKVCIYTRHIEDVYTAAYVSQS